MDRQEQRTPLGYYNCLSASQWATRDLAFGRSERNKKRRLCKVCGFAAKTVHAALSLAVLVIESFFTLPVGGRGKPAESSSERLRRLPCWMYPCVHL